MLYTVTFYYFSHTQFASLFTIRKGELRVVTWLSQDYRIIQCQMHNSQPMILVVHTTASVGSDWLGQPTLVGCSRDCWPVMKKSDTKGTCEIVCAVQWLVDKSCPTLCNPMDGSLPGSYVLGDSLGRDTGVSGHTLLQGIFQIHGLNPGLLHCRQILYHLSHQAKLYMQLSTILNYRNICIWNKKPAIPLNWLPLE